MKRNHAFITCACLALSGQIAFAQTAAPAVAPEKEVVTLPTFTITETPANPYLSKQALSASRVAMSIQDIPQTVSVVTSEFMQDSQSFRLLDAAKYVTPIVESTLPFGGDRYTIRGFQVSHEFVDGTEISGADGYSMSLAPYNIERVEIIKGPNAILVPGGSPGGQMNPITKAPIMQDKSSVTLELAQYFSNAVSADVNRVISKEHGIAARVVAAYWDSDGYARNHFRRGYMFAPSFSWQLSPAHQLIVKAEFVQNRETNLGGLPLDPSIGSGQEAVIARGLPRDWSFASDNDFDQRHRATERITFELLSSLGDHVSSRLQFMANHVVREDQGGTSAALTGAGGGSRNPYTGLYEPGVNWNTAAWTADTTGTVVLAATPAPVTDPSTWSYTRNYGAVDLFYNEAHFRNDYAIKFETPWFKTTTIPGVSANFSKVQFKSYAAKARPTVAANALASATYPDLVYTEPTVADAGGNRTGKQEDLQVFVYENLSLLQDRVQLSGGVSRFYGQLTRVDNTGLLPAIVAPSYNISTTAKTFGAVIKPIKHVSLFYGYNTSGGTMPSSLNPGTYLKSFRAAAGTQKEFGVKTSLLNDRLTASFSHFDIQQQNYSVPNSDYYTLVAQGRFAEAAALENPLYLNLNSKGWEFEATYAVNQNLTLIGNYTQFKIRQPVTEVRVRGVPDKSGAIYADYRFSEGVLKNFGVSVGVDFKDDVVGENSTGYTSTRPLPTGPQFVPNQPSFIVAGRTLVNVGVSYRAKDWTARLQLNNALDEDYILAAGSRTSVLVGDPINLKASVTYKF
ncbi:TonB-dependent siderophore receptor [Oleiharenicola lentus]|uniref:TonB-dependent siderophore receptor n=1 Tax=Oleiharenicola lentus TaxID=2508720 RepID=UPI003F66EA22